MKNPLRTSARKRTFKQAIRDRLQAKRQLSPRQQRKYNSMVYSGAHAEQAAKKVKEQPAQQEAPSETFGVVELPCIPQTASPEQVAEERGWKQDKTGRWRENGRFVKKDLLAEAGLLG